MARVIIMSRGMRVISMALMPMPAPVTIQSQESAMTRTSATTTTARSRRNTASNTDVASSVTAAGRPYFTRPLRAILVRALVRPTNRRVVSVLAGIVPTHAVVGERAVLAANGKRKFIWRNRMADRSPNLAGWVKAAQRFHRHGRYAGNVDRSAFPLHGEADRHFL